MIAYYNEHDPYAAQWLRNLIAAGNAIVPQVAAEILAAYLERPIEGIAA